MRTAQTRRVQRKHPAGFRSVTILIAFLHHLAAFTLVSALAIELMLIHQKLNVANIRRLLLVDAFLGAAGILLVVGLLRVFVFEKGGDYYFSILAFIVKLGVFIGWPRCR